MSLATDRSSWLGQALIAMLGLAAAAYGQNQTPAAPNLSGTWELINIDGNRDTKHPKFPKMKLIVEQDTNQLKVTEKRIKRGKEEVRTFVYNVDGRGDTNTSRVEVWRIKDRQLKSVTRAKEDRVITEYERELLLGLGATQAEAVDTARRQTDVWRLEASGKTLTLTTKTMDVRTASIGGHPPTEWMTNKLKFRRI